MYEARISRASICWEVNMAKKNVNNDKLKYAAIPAAIGAVAGAALLLKKIPRPGVEKTGNPVKDLFNSYKAGIKAKRNDIIEVSAEPEEYDAEEIREFIEENLCVKEITEQDWLLGGVKLLFAAIETNYNNMLVQNGITEENPVWHGYIAATEGEGKYILKAAKESTEDIYMFWEEKTGFIFALHEGMDYLMQLQCGMSAEDFENQSAKYMSYMGLLEVLINKFDIELNEDMDLVDVLENCVIEAYYDKNESK